MRYYIVIVTAICMIVAVGCKVKNVSEIATPEAPTMPGPKMTKSNTITGTVANFEADQGVQLYFFDPISQKKDKLADGPITADGSYQIKYNIPEASLLRIDFPGGQYAMLAVDETQTEINIDAEGKRGGSLMIKGSPASEKLLAYDAFRSESNTRLIRPTYDAMRAAGETNTNPAEEIKAVEAYVKASNEHRKELIDFTETEIGTSIALYGTVLRWTGDEEVSRLESLVNAFEDKHPNLSMTKAMKDKVTRYKRTAIGATAPIISEVDSSGNILNLYDAKGEVTLIDFWASWCGPCLRQVPDLLDAYDKYHDKGFEIYGVSVDSKEKSWKSAIAKYAMPWPNVSDLKGWGSKTAADYNATFVPYNLLLDSDGKIIAKNLHSKELQVKLDELLN